VKLEIRHNRFVVEDRLPGEVGFIQMHDKCSSVGITLCNGRRVLVKCDIFL
jgi:hypothetical protein